MGQESRGVNWRDHDQDVFNEGDDDDDTYDELYPIMIMMMMVMMMVMVMVMVRKHYQVKKEEKGEGYDGPPVKENDDDGEGANAEKSICKEKWGKPKHR